LTVFSMSAQARVHVEEKHTLVDQLFLELVVGDLG